MPKFSYYHRWYNSHTLLISKSFEGIEEVSCWYGFPENTMDTEEKQMVVDVMNELINTHTLRGRYFTYVFLP